MSDNASVLTVKAGDHILLEGFDNLSILFETYDGVDAKLCVTSTRTVTIKGNFHFKDPSAGVPGLIGIQVNGEVYPKGLRVRGKLTFGGAPEARSFTVEFTSNQTTDTILPACSLSVDQGHSPLIINFFGLTEAGLQYSLQLPQTN